ncbi:MAG: outer membrane protein assembly factor BamA [Alphaproteobacteria bacterium]|nr:outer membrane protein assembly factor BamA [Alphaproteobacteria bacterium]
MLLRYFIVLFGLLCFSSNVKAQQLDSTISDIKVVFENVGRLEKETVLSYLPIKVGSAINAQVMDEALKALYATGFFADVKLAEKDGILYVKIKENPLVGKISFEGNKKIKAEQLMAELSLQPRTLFTRAKIQKDTQRILEGYKRIGRYSAVVEPKIIERAQNRVDVVFEISEGKQALIRKIDFIGNNSYDDDLLEESILSKEARWYRWFTSMDSYDPDRFVHDLEMLKLFYFNHGFLDFEVLAYSAELTPDKTGFYLTVNMNEGKRYKIESVDVKSTLKGFKPSSVEDEISIKKGKIYNQAKIENNVSDITDAVGAQGFTFIDVDYKIEKIQTEEKYNKVKVFFNVNEGQHVFVDRIVVQGNSRTKDNVIRREYRIGEGDAYNVAKIRRSKQRLDNLNYFDKNDIEIVPDETNRDKVVLQNTVSEKSTGAFKIGVGWSSYDGPLAEISITERNLKGTGRTASASATIAEKKTLFDIGFSEPWFLGRELDLGFDVFYLTRNYKDESSYNSEMFGASSYLSWKYSEELSHTLKYTIRQDRIFDIKNDASIYVKDQKGKTITSMISHSLFWDYLDNKYNPTEGYYVSVSNDYAGVGGDTSYLKSGLNIGYYFPLSDKWILGLSTSGNYMFGINKDVRLNDRYFLGGGNLRGFESGGVNARDKHSKDSLGGLWQATATAQVTFPLGLPSEFGMRGKIFSDVGWTGKPEDFKKEDMNYSSKMRQSVGIGLVWNSPMGPINIDYAIPVAKEDYDETEYFRLNFGTSF